MLESAFSNLSDDVILNILYKLESDPRHWARIACVSTKFSSLIRTVCFLTKCTQSIPSVVSDLQLSPSTCPPGGWSSLYKLSVCCPGLSHSGVLLQNSDFGLERVLGPDIEITNNNNVFFSDNNNAKLVIASTSTSNTCIAQEEEVTDCGWSLYDDLFYDTLYDNNEVETRVIDIEPPASQPEIRDVKRPRVECDDKSKSKSNRMLRSHLASGVWNLSREQGNKLLASRFKGDCLYICDWPGCVHVEEKRNYMLFRGVFKDFKKSRVWRTINDGDVRSKVGLGCAFCDLGETWDLHSSFCLRRYFGYHDDGEPVVRAYVCENGHVSGAWTDWPLYT